MFCMESLTLDEAVGVNSKNDTPKRRKIRWALPYGFAVCFTDDA
jgi:hypothetical protein